MGVYHEIIHSHYSVRKLYKENGLNHLHQKIEIIYILTGTCEITIGTTTRKCIAGDVIVVHSGETHLIKDMDSSTLYICLFEPEMLGYFRSDTRYIKPYISGDFLRQAGIDQEIRHIFEEIYREHTSRETWHDALIRANIIKMYSLLVRHFERTPNEQQQFSLNPPKFQQALSYIEENYDKNITLSDIAQITHYNSCYVSSLFVTNTGLNFKAYLDNLRINKAITLIEQTDHTLADIAEQCGFRNIRTFNNVFRRIKGTTPGELRKVHN